MKEKIIFELITNLHAIIIERTKEEPCPERIFKSTQVVDQLLPFLNIAECFGEFSKSSIVRLLMKANLPAGLPFIKHLLENKQYAIFYYDLLGVAIRYRADLMIEAFKSNYKNMNKLYLHLIEKDEKQFKDLLKASALDGQNLIKFLSFAAATGQLHLLTALITKYMNQYSYQLYRTSRKPTIANLSKTSLNLQDAIIFYQNKIYCVNTPLNLLMEIKKTEKNKAAFEAVKAQFSVNFQLASPQLTILINQLTGRSKALIAFNYYKILKKAYQMNQWEIAAFCCQSILEKGQVHDLEKFIQYLQKAIIKPKFLEKLLSDLLEKETLDMIVVNLIVVILQKYAFSLNSSPSLLQSVLLNEALKTKLDTRIRNILLLEPLGKIFVENLMRINAFSVQTLFHDKELIIILPKILASSNIYSLMYFIEHPFFKTAYQDKQGNTLQHLAITANNLPFFIRLNILSPEVAFIPNKAGKLPKDCIDSGSEINRFYQKKWDFYCQFYKSIIAIPLGKSLEFQSSEWGQVIDTELIVFNKIKQFLIGLESFIVAGLIDADVALETYVSIQQILLEQLRYKRAEKIPVLSEMLCNNFSIIIKGNLVVEPQLLNNILLETLRFIYPFEASKLLDKISCSNFLEAVVSYLSKVAFRIMDACDLHPADFSMQSKREGPFFERLIAQTLFPLNFHFTEAIKCCDKHLSLALSLQAIGFNHELEPEDFLHFFTQNLKIIPSYSSKYKFYERSLSDVLEIMIVMITTYSGTLLSMIRDKNNSLTDNLNIYLLLKALANSFEKLIKAIPTFLNLSLASKFNCLQTQLNEFKDALKVYDDQYYLSSFKLYMLLADFYEDNSYLFQAVDFKEKERNSAFIAFEKEDIETLYFNNQKIIEAIERTLQEIMLDQKACQRYFDWIIMDDEFEKLQQELQRVSKIIVETKPRVTDLLVLKEKRRLLNSIKRAILKSIFCVRQELATKNYKLCLIIEANYIEAFTQGLLQEESNVNLRALKDYYEQEMARNYSDYAFAREEFEQCKQDNQRLNYLGQALSAEIQAKIRCNMLSNLEITAPIPENPNLLAARESSKLQLITLQERALDSISAEQLKQKSLTEAEKKEEQAKIALISIKNQLYNLTCVIANNAKEILVFSEKIYRLHSLHLATLQSNTFAIKENNKTYLTLLNKLSPLQKKEKKLAHVLEEKKTLLTAFELTLLKYQKKEAALQLQLQTISVDSEIKPPKKPHFFQETANISLVTIEQNFLIGIAKNLRLKLLQLNICCQQSANRYRLVDNYRESLFIKQEELNLFLHQYYKNLSLTLIENINFQWHLDFTKQWIIPFVVDFSAQIKTDLAKMLLTKRHCDAQSLQINQFFAEYTAQIEYLFAQSHQLSFFDSQSMDFDLLWDQQFQFLTILQGRLIMHIQLLSALEQQSLTFLASLLPWRGEIIAIYEHNKRLYEDTTNYFEKLDCDENANLKEWVVTCYEPTVEDFLNYLLNQSQNIVLMDKQEKDALGHYKEIQLRCYRVLEMISFKMANLSNKIGQEKAEGDLIQVQNNGLS